MENTLGRGGGIALWRQIEEELRAEILDGTWTAGQRLPTEVMLADRFQVNRHTVRRALAHLRETGLIRTAQGAGLFVADGVIDYPVGRHTRWKENIGRGNRRPSAHILGWRTIAAAGVTAARMRLPEGAPVLVIETLRHADETPLTLSNHHLPADRFEGIETTFARTMSMTDAMAEHGVTVYQRRQTWVSTRLPRGREARLLRQSVADPVLVTHGITVDQDGVPVDYGISLFAGARVRIRVDDEHALAAEDAAS